MNIYIYKIFDLNTSGYFSDVYFNIEDVARAFYSAIKQHPNVEIHKLFLTQIVDLEAESIEEDLYNKAWTIYTENYAGRDSVKFTGTKEPNVSDSDDTIYIKGYV